MREKIHGDGWSANRGALAEADKYINARAPLRYVPPAPIPTSPLYFAIAQPLLCCVHGKMPRLTAVRVGAEFPTLASILTAQACKRCA